MMLMTWLVEHREILKDYRDGRPEAWRAIYDHYVDDVRRFISLGFSFESQGRKMRFNGFSSPLDVDDVVQEAFVRAFSEPARLNYDGLHAFKNYLLAIARNIVLQDFKSLVRLVALCDSEEEQADAFALGHSGPDPEQLLLDHEMVELARAFSESLSHYDRRFYELRFQQQLSQDDTARRLKATRAKVRTCERRVRQRLVRFLRQRNFFADTSTSTALVAPTVLSGVP